MRTKQQQQQRSLQSHESNILPRTEVCNKSYINHCISIATPGSTQRLDLLFAILYKIEFYSNRIDHFRKQYKVYTGAFAGKSHIDEGGKIILPSSTLEELANLNIVWPIMLKVTNPQQGISTHCGVLEFSAEEGRAYIPFWMQEHLRLSPGQLLVIENASLHKGTYVKIRPQQKAFIENISDPKVVLEQKLRNFSCLTTGDTIMIRHLDHDYCIDILEVRANNMPDVDSISITETDVEVDFERPLDMPLTPEPVRRERLEQQFDHAMMGSEASASGSSAQNEAIIGRTGAAPKRRYRSKKEKDEERARKEKEEQERFVAFQGSGRRLDGKQLKTVGASPPITSFMSRAAPSAQDKQTSNGNGLVIGDRNDGNQQTQTESKESKFVPFGGQGRSLK